jgi:asparagine synthase (glutamine-hydrolysing)
MLQLVMWADRLCRDDSGRTFRWPRQSLIGIRRSVHWLLALMDSESGRTPNLGANDGAYIFPMTVLPIDDYRPVLHAAARLFLEYDLPHGPWDEMALWFGARAAGRGSMSLPRYVGDQIYGKTSWAYLRTAQFTSRPSHADQLHLDLWWRGMNATPDAGTYLYNADSPWDNSLAAAWVHNTVTVNGKDQFTRAGRFLYLDWYNAYRISLSAEDPSVLQQVRGRTRAGGNRHTRIVSVSEDDRWLVEDEILPLHMPWDKKPRVFRLHWLLPDWKWNVENMGSRVLLRLESPQGPVTLTVQTSPPGSQATFSLARAGGLLAGSGAPGPTRGWVSPLYGIKVPALSLAVEIKSKNEVKFSSEFIFPK